MEIKKLLFDKFIGIFLNFAFNQIYRYIVKSPLFSYIFLKQILFENFHENFFSFSLYQLLFD
ncbi:MAG: hypothetical protein D8H95_43820 [Lachnospiraceae bacterium]|nr:MAG: hypothetical protein D8H95_43820 [Lachnospiraceae bacterium]